jgi:hypothetical protein
MTPLLYHVMKGLLDKGEVIDANFIMLRYGGAPITGPIPFVKVNKDGDMVVYARHGSALNFRTIDEEDADLLELVHKDHGWILTNVAKKEKTDEGVVLSGPNDDEPLEVHIIQNLLDKGAKIEFIWTDYTDYAHGPLLSVRWNGRGVEVHFKDSMQDHQVVDVYLAGERFSNELHLQKTGTSWVLSKEK